MTEIAEQDDYELNQFWEALVELGGLCPNISHIKDADEAECKVCQRFAELQKKAAAEIHMLERQLEEATDKLRWLASPSSKRQDK